MRPTKQTVLHSPEEGQNGNCFSAVLASLLHLPIELIPYFAGYAEWRRDLNQWLRQFGLAYLEVNACDLKEHGIEGLHHEVAGTSPRSDDVLHATVGLDGAIVFDPHPSDAGLAKVETYGLFLVLEPWKLAALPKDEAK